jgi:AraC-like DNA-binding protein
MVRRKDPSSGHAFFAFGLVDAFRWLGISASVVSPVRGWRIMTAFEWRAIHTEPSVVDFEMLHGAELARQAYNACSVARARESQRPVRTEHAGLSDYFVPIVEDDEVPAILVVGPFQTARPTGNDILERWRRMTGRQGHPAEPEFAHYLSTTLSTLVLEGPLVSDFERLLVCIARLIAGAPDRGALLREGDALRAKLELATRSAERTWDAAQSMISERTESRWSSPHMVTELARQGLPRVPDQVLVGLVVDRHAEKDPVDALLRRNAFQHAAVQMALASGGVIAGRVGDHGIVLLCAKPGASARRTRALVALAEKAADHARRRFGLELYLGLGPTTATARLSEQYQKALHAADTALLRGMRLVRASSPELDRVAFPLHELTHELGRLGEERPGDLPAHFDRYLETVAAHARYQIDAVRAHLENAFEHVARALLDNGTLSQKAFAEASAGLVRETRDARTVADLFSAHRHVIADLAEAARKPIDAHRERGLRRAIEHIERHYAEPLRRSAVSHVAGYAPSHFSRLFRRREGMTFEEYLARRRVEHAKGLLSRTHLDTQRIAELSGFGTRQYLARVFRRLVGLTPREHRNSTKGL